MDSNSDKCGITIIVPNYNSSLFLSKLLESINLSEGIDRLPEVLVVDDSNTDEAAATQNLCNKYGANYLWCEGNVAKKRNFGVEKATNTIVLFTDSDCELSPKTILEHLKLGNTDSEIGGMLGLIEFTGPENWMWSVVERTGFLGAFSFARRMKFAPWGVTANLSIKRKVFLKVNGFDESFLQAPGGEDVELGLRINKSGYKIYCNPNAKIFHTRNTWNTLGRMFTRVFGYGRAHFHVIIKHMDQVGIEYPRLGFIILFTGLLLTLISIIMSQFFPIVNYIIFILVVMGVQASLILLLEKRNFRYLLQEMLANGLDLVYEVGLIFESLRNKDLRGIWLKMIYAEKQLINERTRKIIQAWSVLVGFLILIIVSIIWGII